MMINTVASRHWHCQKGEGARRELVAVSATGTAGRTPPRPALPRLDLRLVQLEPQLGTALSGCTVAHWNRRPGPAPT